jgi:anti-anti-sigma factor
LRRLAQGELVKLIESGVDGVPLIVVEGDLDHSSAPAVFEAVTDAFHGVYPSESLLIDLTDCAFVDSGGLSVLLTALTQLPPGGWLGIIGASAGTNRVLQYTGFLERDRVRFFSSLSDAATSLARERRLLQGEKGEPPKK